MGEYALHKGQLVKIGVTENIFGLRADQIGQAPGGINIPLVRNVLLFRFPFPDEDGTPPGGYRDEFRVQPLPGFQMDHGHRDPACCGEITLTHQRFHGDRLVVVVQCQQCRAAWRLEDLDDAQPVIDSLHAQAGQVAGADELAAVRLRTIADRVTAGYATEYPTLEAFYDDKPERRTSGEADYGVHWHLTGSSRFPRWRVSYVQATGEVYAVCQNGSLPGPVRVLGVVEPDPVAAPGSLHPASDDLYYRTLDKILAGWADPDVSEMRLAWVIGRLAEAGRLA